MKHKLRINADVIIGTICVLIGAFFYFTQIEKLPEKSQVFPRIAFLLFIFLSLLLVALGLFSGLRQSDETETSESSKTGKEKTINEIKSTLIVTLIIAVFIAIMYVANYYIAAFLFIPCLMLFFNVRNWKLITGITLVMTGGMFVLFELLLQVPLH